MIEATLLGVGLLLLMATWTFMLRPSMLDATRDRLFDLRESMRAHFIQSGHGLNAPAYHALRGLLNSHLRYTEEITFFGVLHQMVWLQGHQDTHRNRRADVDRQFAVSDPGLAAYIREVRAKSAVIVLDYAVKSSLAGLLLALVGFAVIYTRKALAVLCQALHTSSRARRRPSSRRPPGRARCLRCRRRWAAWGVMSPWPPWRKARFTPPRPAMPESRNRRRSRKTCDVARFASHQARATGRSLSVFWPVEHREMRGAMGLRFRKACCAMGNIGAGLAPVLNTPPSAA